MQNRCSVLRMVAAVLPLFLLLLLEGCGGKAPATLPPMTVPPATEAPMKLNTALSASLIASKDLNSGSGRAGRPVVVRLYELKTAGSFSSADFFSLYEREAETLGSDLIGREEITLAPGQRHRIDKIISPETAYLGVVAAFRDIDQAKWRTTTRLQSDVTNKIVVNVAADRVGAAAYEE